MASEDTSTEAQIGSTKSPVYDRKEAQGGSVITDWGNLTYTYRSGWVYRTIP